MAKNVQCCYCQNLGIRFDEEHVPYDWCEKVTDSPDPLRERECEYYEKLVPTISRENLVKSRDGREITNADRIRQMSDEELAEFMRSVCDTWYIDANQNWLEWLKSPAERREE